MDSYMEKNNNQITITPATGKSKDDFNEMVQSSSWAWDEADPKTSKFPPKVGQLFGFYFPPKKGVRAGHIIIHRVTNILGSEYRNPSWSTNVGQGDRKVLALTQPLRRIEFLEWDQLGGLKKKQGTYTSNLNDNTPRKKKLKEALKDI